MGMKSRQLSLQASKYLSFLRFVAYQVCLSLNHVLVPLLRLCSLKQCCNAQGVILSEHASQGVKLTMPGS